MKYDIAFSFASEDEFIAHALIYELQVLFGLSIFYYKNEQATLLGSNLMERLLDIYSDEARYFVPLISSNYVKKGFTRQEFRAALDKLQNEPDRVYILPIRLDDTKVPGLPKTTAYLEIRGLEDVQRVARILFEKVTDPLKLDNAVRLAESLFREGRFEEAFEHVKGREFDQNVDALRVRDEVYRKQGKIEDSIKALETILTIHEDDFMVHKKLGNRYITIQKFDLAIKHFMHAEEILAGDPVVAEGLQYARKKLAEKQEMGN